MSGSSIARSSAVMAAGTLASRILGLVRNALLIAALGATASGAADAFNISNMLPTQLYNLIIGGVLNAILVPQILQALRQRNGEEIVNRLLTTTSLIIAGAAAIMTVAAPLIIMIYASGLGRWQTLAFYFAFWCMPQIFFYGLYALWGQVLNARGSFGPYMWSPVLNNVISIGALIVYLQVYGSYQGGGDPGVWDASRIALVGGTATLGIAAQALILYIPMVRSGFRPRFILGIRGVGLGTASKVAMWALVGTAVVSLGDIAVTNLGSRATTAAESGAYGSAIVPSTTMYANALLVYMLPQSLVTTSIITALFTRMSAKAAAGDARGVRDDLSVGLRSVGVFTVLFAAGIATLAAPALQIFVPSISLQEASAGAPVLAVLAAGIVGQGIWFTTQRVMLAYSDTKRLIIADVVVGVIPVVTCLVVYLLAPATWWMVGAAAGTALGLLGGSVAIVPLLRRHIPNLDGRRVASTYARLIIAVLPAVLVGIGMRWLAGPVDGSRTGTRALDALILTLAVALVMTVVYLVAARALRVEELGILLRPLSRLVGALGRRLPGGLGRLVVGLSRVIDLPPVATSAVAPSMPSATASRPEPPVQAAMLGERIGPMTTTQGGAQMSRTTDEGTPIGSGRYQLLGTLPTTLPRIIRHLGRDTILDREVTIWVLTPTTPHRTQILEIAARAVLVEDERMQRVHDVETGAAGDQAFIVTEPASGRLLPRLVQDNLTPAQARAIIGETAELLDACARRGLHHLHLSPESIRLRPGGLVQVAGVGIEAAARGTKPVRNDPMAVDRADARALVELLYYALTGRWPGKHSGIPAAPRSHGVPVPPSTLNTQMGPQDADLDALVARTWSQEDIPISAAEIAQALGPWDRSVLTDSSAAPDQPTPSGSFALPAAARGVLSRLKGLSSARALRGGLFSSKPASDAAPAEQAPPQDASVQAGAPVPQAGAPVPQEGAGLAEPVALAAQEPVEPGGAEVSGADTLAQEPAGQDAAASQEVEPDLPPSFAPGSAPTADAQTQPSSDHADTSLPAAIPPGMPAPVASPASGAQPDPGRDPGPGRLEPVVGPYLAPAAAQPQTAAASDLTGARSGQDVSQAFAQDWGGQESPEPRMNRTTSIMLGVVGAVMAIGLIFAIYTIAQLGNLSLTDKDVPAASTVPTSAAPATPDQGGDGGGGEQAAPIQITGVNTGDQHPETAGNLTDGNGETMWFSKYYTSADMDGQTMAISLTLAQAASVSSIEMQGTGGGGNVQIRATTPEDPTGGTLLTEGPFVAGTTTLSFEATETSSIVILITQLPQVNGKNRATISEITLR